MSEVFLRLTPGVPVTLARQPGQGFVVVVAIGYNGAEASFNASAAGTREETPSERDGRRASVSQK